MRRYVVERGPIKWKGTMYETGDIMPATFTDRAMMAHIYSRRFKLTEVPEEQPVVPVVTTTSEPPVSSNLEEATSPASSSVFGENPNVPPADTNPGLSSNLDDTASLEQSHPAPVIAPVAVAVAKMATPTATTKASTGTATAKTTTATKK